MKAGRAVAALVAAMAFLSPGSTRAAEAGTGGLTTAPGGEVSEAVLAAEVGQAMQVTAGMIKMLRKRARRQRRRSKKKDAHPLVCAAVREVGRKSTLSTCFEASRGAEQPLNQFGENCGRHNDLVNYDDRRASCQNDNGCQWFGQPGTPKEEHSCVVNACFRINNGRCTIQHTGGRCVWWTREQNRRFFGRDFAGCYVSPCHHPIPNNRRGCTQVNRLLPWEHRGSEDDSLKEDSPFQCTFCFGGTGCVNRKLTSQAQCQNIGDKAGCSGLCNTKLGEACPSRKCQRHCCGNDAYCNCAARSLPGEETGAIDVIFP